MVYIKEFNGLIEQFFSLPPYEFTLIGNVVAYFIAKSLTNSQQNSFGNLLELVAQVLLTIQAQSDNTDVNIQQEDIDYLISILSSRYTNKEQLISLLNKIKHN